MVNFTETNEVNTILKTKDFDISSYGNEKMDEDCEYSLDATPLEFTNMNITNIESMLISAAVGKSA